MKATYMARSWTMEAIIQERFGQPSEKVMPDLITKYRTPYWVAVELGVYPNSVRKWLERHNWTNENGEWQPPKTTSTSLTEV